MAIDPDKTTPADMASVTTLQSMTEESAKAAMRSGVDGSFGLARGSFLDILSGIGQILGGALQLGVGALSWIAQGVVDLVAGIAGAIQNQFTTEAFEPVREALHDGQNGLIARLDLIPPYCSAVMSHNVQMRWLGATVIMPFRTQNGPAKGAHVDPDLSGIVFDEPGTWTVHALLNANGGDGVFGGSEMWMHVRLYRADGTLDAEKIIRAHPGSNEHGFSMSQPFVIPESGWYVCVAGRSGLPRWWPGGARWSGLTVIKSHNDSDHGAPDEVTGQIDIEEPAP